MKNVFKIKRNHLSDKTKANCLLNAVGVGLFSNFICGMTARKPRTKAAIAVETGLGIAISYGLGLIFSIIDVDTDRIYEEEDGVSEAGTLISDRYSGTYSGGEWTKWSYNFIPDQILADDVTCARAWGLLRKLREDGRICFGVGDSCDEAEADSATWRTRHVKNGTTSYISKEEFNTLFVEKYGETEEAVPEMKSHFYGGDELPTSEFTGGEPIPSVGKASDENWD